MPDSVIGNGTSMTSRPHCPFCDEGAGGHSALLRKRLGGKLAGRVVTTTENFVVLCDLGPLVVCHVLIVPKQHLLSLGAIENSKHWTELIELKGQTRLALAQLVAQPVFFEHGSNSFRRGGTSVEHAHLHAVPGNIGLSDSLQGFEVTQISDLRSLRLWAARDIPYLLFENTVGVMLVAEGVENIPRQFMRREAVRLLGLPSSYWDWTASRHSYEEVIRTFSLLEGFNWRSAGKEKQ